MKTTVVVFTQNNVRILTLKNATKEQLDRFHSMPNAVVNPDRSKVKNLPPHFWSLTKSGNIVPLSEEEQKQRSIGLTPAKLKNVVELPARIINRIKIIEVPKKIKPLVYWGERLLYSALGAAITLLLKEVL